MGLLKRLMVMVAAALMLAGCDKHGTHRVVVEQCSASARFVETRCRRDCESFKPVYVMEVYDTEYRSWKSSYSTGSLKEARRLCEKS